MSREPSAPPEENFEKDLQNLNLASVVTVESSTATAFHAYTFLQPNFDEAERLDDAIVRRSEESGSWSDHVLYDSGCWNGTLEAVDNTGLLNYVTEVFLPSRQFPSDHAIVSATLMQ